MHVDITTDAGSWYLIPVRAQDAADAAAWAAVLENASDAPYVSTAPSTFVMTGSSTT